MNEIEIKGVKLIKEYLDIAQPDKGKTQSSIPENSRIAYYWMAMGIAQFLQKYEVLHSPKNNLFK